MSCVECSCELDGDIAALDGGSATISELLQQHLVDSKLVKGFNHILSGAIMTDATASGTVSRRALATSSDVADAVELMTRVCDEFGSRGLHGAAL